MRKDQNTHRALTLARHIICTPANLPVLTPARSASLDTCPGYEGNLEHNWCGNVRFYGKSMQPASLPELQGMVREGVGPIRVVGRGHSFSPIAECAGGTLISLWQMRKILNFHPPTANKLGSITIEGGATYTDIIQFLSKRGALRNLPSCPQFTVAGAIATGSHGYVCEYVLHSHVVMELVKISASGLGGGSWASTAW